MYGSQATPPLGGAGNGSSVPGISVNSMPINAATAGAGGNGMTATDTWASILSQYGAGGASFGGGLMTNVYDPNSVRMRVTDKGDGMLHVGRQLDRKGKKALEVIPPKSSLTLAIMLLLERLALKGYIAFYLIFFMVKAYQFQDFRLWRLREESWALVGYAVVNYLRLGWGDEANKCENTRRAAHFLFGTAGYMMLIGYFYTAQVYVLKADRYINLTLLIFAMIEAGYLAFSSTVLFRNTVTVGPRGQVVGRYGQSQAHDQVLVGIACIVCALAISWVLFWADVNQKEEKVTCPETQTDDCTRTTDEGWDYWIPFSINLPGITS